MAWHTPEDAGDWPWPVWESDTFDKPHKPGKDWAKLVVFASMIVSVLALYGVGLACLWVLVK